MGREELMSQELLLILVPFIRQQHHVDLEEKKSSLKEIAHCIVKISKRVNLKPPRVREPRSPANKKIAQTQSATK